MKFTNQPELSEGDIALVIRTDGKIEIVSAVTPSSIMSENGKQIQDNMLSAVGFVRMAGDFEGQRILHEHGTSVDALIELAEAAGLTDEERLN